MIYNVLVYLTFGISTLITVWIIYAGIDTLLASNYLIFYVLFVLFFILYVSVVFLAKRKRLNKTDIKKRIGTFMITFIVISSAIFIYQYIFRKTAINYYRVFSPAIIIAYWSAFSNLIFSRKRM